ncbi:Porin subfamily protein [Methylobacterium sp. ap11]|uniref:porin n=1 Tax=Methylobacterium sp. ap11 TaxID=1761799 RepID=UPI0008D06108|nr:porin [Methylobacterium sp. ap11]SEO84139.1 Porin subfamily protein [Methylobacterium sp. ap11]
MKLFKSLLLGSAAGLTVVAGAHAADLPIKKAAPVEYVRVCSTHGAGFFYIPGTDTCLRVSGRARFQATYLQAYSRAGDLTGYQGLGRLNLDARTATGYGTLRAFVRFDLAYGTGPFLASGTQRLAGTGFPGQGVDTFGRSITTVNVDKAFIQFAGFTAGRAASFFDFYAHDLEFVASSLGSDISSTNLLAYTATFGNGFSATLSVEDPLLRKTPIFGSGTAGGNFVNYQVFTAGAGNFAPVLGTNAFGQPVIADYDVVQRQRMPDFVGALRYDAAWGSAQVSAAVHELNTGNASQVRSFGGFSTVGGVAPRPTTEYGWAVQGGLKINLPFIAAGDLLYLQGSYGEGALRYTGYNSWLGGYTASASLATGTTLATSLVDAVVNPVNGKLDLSTSWTVSAAYLHYWAPEWRSSVFGSYGEVAYGKASRANLGLVNQLGGFNTSTLPSPFAAGYGFSSVLRDTNQVVAGASIIWSPVRDLDIGLEGNYARLALQSGRVIDQNKAPGLGGANVAGVVNGVPVTAAGVALPTTSATDTFQIRMRVQRDF